MADKKIIAVVGATGAQGGGLVRAILPIRTAASPPAPSPATRVGQGEGARALGAEVVAGGSRRRGERPKRAFDGAYGAFCVTNYWEHFSPEQGASAGAQHGPRGEGGRRAARDLVDARGHAQAGCRSTTTACRRCMGKYKVPHFDAKGEADAFFADAGVPTTFLLTSFYWDNFIYFGIGPAARPGRQARAHASRWATAKLPGIAAEDIGKCAYGIFKAGDEFIGKTVGIAGEHADRRADGGGADARRSARRCAYNDGARPRSIAASASRAPTTSATCSSSSATSRRTSAARATSTQPRAEPGAADLRRVAQDQHRTAFPSPEGPVRVDA